MKAPGHRPGAFARVRIPRSGSLYIRENSLICRDETRFANLSLISGRQMHRINVCIFLVAITKKQPDKGCLKHKIDI